MPGAPPHVQPRPPGAHPHRGGAHPHGGGAGPHGTGIHRTGRVLPDAHPVRRLASWPGVAIYVDGAWWVWSGESGIADWVELSASPCALGWRDVAQPSAELLQLAGQALVASGGDPVATTSSPAYLYALERGSVVVRVCDESASTIGDAPPPIPHVLKIHPPGLEGVHKSGREIADQIARDFRRWRVIEWARQVAASALAGRPRGVPDPRTLLWALFQDLKRRTVFVKDPQNTEAIGSTEAVLCLDPRGVCLRGGDCDEMLVCLGSGSMALGIPIRIRTRIYRQRAQPGGGAPRRAAQGHVEMMFDAAPRGDSVWECIDPSTEAGHCSSVAVVDEWFDDVDEGPTMFVGVGQAPDVELAGTVGAPDDAGEDLAGGFWLDQVAGAVRDAQEALDRNADARHRALEAAGRFAIQPASTVGCAEYAQAQGRAPWSPAADREAAELRGHLRELDQVLEETRAGARALRPVAGDYAIEPRPGDVVAYRLEASPARCDVIRNDALEAPAATLGAALAVAKLARAVADAHYLEAARVHAQGPDEQPGTVGTIAGVPTAHELWDLMMALDYQVAQLALWQTGCIAAWAKTDAASANAWAAAFNKAVPAWVAEYEKEAAYVDGVIEGSVSWDLYPSGSEWSAILDAFAPFHDLFRQAAAQTACAAPSFPATPQPTAPDLDLSTYLLAGRALAAVSSAWTTTTIALTGLAVVAAILGVAYVTGQFAGVRRLARDRPVRFTSDAHPARDSAPGRRRPRCWGPTHHVRDCRLGRPLCRWRRREKGLCYCDALHYPHRMGSDGCRIGVPHAVLVSPSYRDGIKVRWRGDDDPAPTGPPPGYDPEDADIFAGLDPHARRRGRRAARAPRRASRRTEDSWDRARREEKERRAAVYEQLWRDPAFVELDREKDDALRRWNRLDARKHMPTSRGGPRPGEVEKACREAKDRIHAFQDYEAAAMKRAGLPY
jgi:hypothetical protein